MTLLDAGDLEAARERRARSLAAVEEAVEEATAAAMRAFLRRLQREATKPGALTAANPLPRASDLFTLGEVAGWWQEAIDEHLLAQVGQAWRAGYADTRDGALVRSSLDGMETFVGNVRDRLVRTASPTVPEDAFDKLRVALSEEWARGSATSTITDRIAAEFSWDKPERFWQGRADEAGRAIDAILDPLGAPGDPVREAARLGDPRVADLQAQRSEAVKHLDQARTEWNTRAERIARTESTSAYNAATEQALIDEGAGVKVWLAARDDRTREEHVDADGQCVPVHGTFDVGGEALMMPGDPAASPGNIVNCRCSMIGAASCAEAEALLAAAVQ